MSYRYQDSWQEEGGFAVSVFWGSDGQWVAWVEAPSGLHLFANADSRLEARSLALFIVSIARVFTVI